MKGKLHLLFITFIALFTGATLPTSDPEPSYRVESIEMPEGLVSETGAIEFLPDGRLVAGFHRGEILIYDPKTKQWTLFAEGLHDPLGILVVSNTELLIMQRPELTRVKDTDGDGQADVYEKVTDDFGISGNYHEYNYGPVKDTAGNLFVGFNTASPNGSVWKQVRGRLDTLTIGFKGQMFSPVPYRGWIMKLTPDGTLLPYASGFRSPNGLGFDLQGNLFATDNQGDWVGTSPLYHVQEGKFYGHPSSLVWQKGWNKGNPLKLPVAELDQMRTKASVLFPHGIMANSPTQPVWDKTQGKFGPFAGQLFVGEMNQGRIVRVMLEEVGGQWQGACIPFLDDQGLRKGNNRLAFAPDGSLWVGQNDHGWAGDRGIQRIVFTGKTPMDVYTMKLTNTGFELTFTQPVDEKSATDLNTYKFRRYRYAYHAKYGSDQSDVQAVAVTHVSLSADRRKVSLDLESLKPGYVYELQLGDIQAATGEPIANKIICYTLNRLAI
ncbi:PQQ-dependent sugar dehydrogenase [Rhodocytophaga aerolata]|uniref:PQQ-dependent sugar dehydrogenase n=1 Tax=Rhodocytophaga aerolata TaxID=455078 RepID=A0ABT8RFP5_9BACT|nr:PQQ-dependent sugar dehydrogenase [Rhodocytophaga aerolata]MDO1450900.1 PQQ-dependent sugar dehydrogenase [Rhodocytophaga aerolata]